MRGGFKALFGKRGSTAPLIIGVVHLKALPGSPDWEADGPGGTAHLVRTTQDWGFKTIELDGRKLLPA